jgi:anti-anti-sigma factor
LTPTSSPVFVALKGELDLSQRPGLDAALSVADDVTTVILDLSETRYLDSSALGAFIALRERLLDRSGGEVLITGADRHVRRILDITGLDAAFQSFDSLDDALSHLGIAETSLERRRFESQLDAS